MKSFFKFIIPVIVLFALSACSFSLAEDVTPPPGADQISVSRTQAAPSNDAVFPLVPPNPASGQAIFAEKCAPCHGSSGQGDGPRASQLPNPVPALASADLARQATPSHWFSIVTRGNLDRFMPPFPSLSDSQRWDVVAYALSLSTTAERINQGMALYQENCARCHGERGRGDGTDVANLSNQPANLSDLAFMSNKTAVDLYQAISAGMPPDMPAFGSQVSDDQRWEITEYLRSMSFSSPPEVASAESTPATEVSATPELTPTLGSVAPQGFGTATGQIINGSGGQIPPNLPVTLHGFDDMQEVITLTTTTRPDGSFQFDNVELVEGRVFLTSVDFSQTTFSSDIFALPPNVDTMDLPITVYETTTDTSVIKVDRLHLFFEMVDNNTMRVVELYIMSNNSNKTLVPTQAGEPLVKFKLPVGSSNLEFQDGALGDRYQETPDGFGDTIPVRPGSGNYQVLFAFQMPYNRKLDFVQPVLLPVDAVVILVPEGDIRVKSDMVQDDGTRNIQETAYHLYNGESLTPGTDLRLSLTGNLNSGFSLTQTSRNGLLIGLGVFGVALIIAGIWFYRHTQLQELDVDEIEDLAESEPTATPESSEALMDAIIALDDLYQAGELDEAAYRKRRDSLKAKLSQAMEPPASGESPA